jgi:hypothetical protein
MENDHLLGQENVAENIPHSLRKLNTDQISQLFDIEKILKGVKSRWVTPILCGIISTILCGIGVYFIPKLYEAESILL